MENVRRAVAPQFLAIAAGEAITQADQVVADVDRRADAVPPVQRFPTVAEGVVVLDVIVYQRRLVKRFDCQCNTANRIGQSDAIRAERTRRALQGIVSRQRDERPRTLAALRKPLVSDPFMN